LEIGNGQAVALPVRFFICSLRPFLAADFIGRAVFLSDAPFSVYAYTAQKNDTMLYGGITHARKGIPYQGGIKATVPSLARRSPFRRFADRLQ
jgi:hypothetical protein